jgi:hypothetical protein
MKALLCFPELRPVVFPFDVIDVISDHANNTILIPFGKYNFLFLNEQSIV